MPFKPMRTLLFGSLGLVFVTAGAAQAQLTMGPSDRPRVDAAAADRGRTVWAADCIQCHGTQARGTDQGPNLVRSVLVLHDRVGSDLGPFLKKGHPTMSGRPSASLTEAQVADLAHFLRQRINDTLRGSPIFREGDVVTGDAKAGETFFNGPGACATCHTASSRSLRGIATRIPSPIDLQQRWLFPGTARGRGAGPAPDPVTVTVTPASGPAITGAMVQIDDFYVTLRDSANAIRVIKRAPGMKVVKNDPLRAHHELLDRLTDKNLHDVTAYLVTLK